MLREERPRDGVRSHRVSLLRLSFWWPAIYWNSHGLFNDLINFLEWLINSRGNLFILVLYKGCYKGYRWTTRQNGYIGQVQWQGDRGVHAFSRGTILWISLYVRTLLDSVLLELCGHFIKQAWLIASLLPGNGPNLQTLTAVKKWKGRTETPSSLIVILWLISLATAPILETIQEHTKRHITFEILRILGFLCWKTEPRLTRGHMWLSRDTDSYKSQYLRNHLYKCRLSNRRWITLID